MAGLLSTFPTQMTQSTTPQTASGGILSQIGAKVKAYNAASVYPGGVMPAQAPATAPKASNPVQNVTQPSTTIAPKYQASGPSQASIQSATATDPSSFNLLSGESTQAYNSRIAALTSGQGGGQTGGAGGGQIGNAPSSNLATTYSQPQTPVQKAASMAGNTGMQAANGGYGATNGGFLNQLMGNAGNNSQFNYDNTNLQNLTNQQATLEQNIVGGDQPLYFKQGEMGQEQQAYQTKLAAAGQAVQNDIGEQNAQTTAATAGATASLPANQNYAVPQGQQVLNAQGQTIASGLQPTEPGQAVFNPATGQYTTASSGGGSPGTAPSGIDQGSWSTYTNDLLSGNTSAIPASITGNANLFGQLQQAATAQNPSFSYNTAVGQGAAQQSNATVGGTATVNAGASAFGQANPAYLKLSTYTMPNIDSFGQLLTSGAGGVNPFSSQYANMSLQQFQNQLSSAQQAQFQTTFQQLKQSIADLAGSGGSQTPTANSSQADATLSPTSKMSTIQATLQRIQQEGDIYLKSQAALNNAALTEAQGGGVGGSTGGTGTFSDSSFFGK